MSAIARIGNIGKIIDYLTEEFDKGNIVGLAVAVKTKEEGECIHSIGDMTFMWDGFGNYPEQIGAAVMLRESMLKKVWE